MIVNGNLPADFGVPEMAPLVEPNDNPGGSVPDEDHSQPGPQSAACRRSEYCTPTVPSGRLPGVIFRSLLLALSARATRRAPTMIGLRFTQNYNAIDVSPGPRANEYQRPGETCAAILDCEGNGLIAGRSGRAGIIPLVKPPEFARGRSVPNHVFRLVGEFAHRLEQLPFPTDRDVQLDAPQQHRQAFVTALAGFGTQPAQTGHRIGMWWMATHIS